MRRAVAPLGLLAGASLVVASGCMERLFYHPERGPTPVPPGLGAEAVDFRSADGTRLHGWFVPARGPAPIAPTIVHAHGNAGNVASHLWFTEYLPAAGMNLFIFDYRGYGQSEGRARARDDLIDDATAAVDAVLARADVDPRRVGLYGQSLGGAIALNVMADRPEIRAAVIESAFSDWREIAASALARSGDPGPVARLLAAALIRGHRRPIDAIRRIDRPLLLLHGDGDEIVPVAHGRALAAAGATVEYVELAGGGHNTLRETHPEVARLTIEFFRRHLVAAPGPVAPIASDARDPR